MARHRALPSLRASDDEPATTQAPAPMPRAAAESSTRQVTPSFRPDIDAERYARLDTLTINTADKRFNTVAVESAKRLWCSTTAHSAKSDRDRVGSLARYLAAEAARVDNFNYKAALRRANVDRYLKARSIHLSPKSVGHLRSALYEVGRLVHPREYPARHAVEVQRIRRIAPTPRDEVRGWYALAPALPSVLSRRLFVLLDLCFGAGARASDLKVLRGTDISETVWEGEPVALVRMFNLPGGTRTVPVADPEMSQRLIALSAVRGSRFLITDGDEEIRKNTVNKIGEHLHKRGHGTINATALRHRWLMNLADTVPAALMMQLADISDIRLLASERHQLPTYGTQHAVAWVKEARA